jgi:hypothetical protein
MEGWNNGKDGRQETGERKEDWKGGELTFKKKSFLLTHHSNIPLFHHSGMSVLKLSPNKSS